MSQLLKSGDFSGLLSSTYSTPTTVQRIQLWDLLLEGGYHDEIAVEEQRPLLKEAFLPIVDAEQLTNDWAAASPDNSRPNNRPWFELFDLADGRALIVPDEADPARRVLAFIDSPRTDGLAVAVFDVEGRAITNGTELSGCGLAHNLKSCNGPCPDGSHCVFKRYASYPVTVHCRCQEN
jgi:hypothetical protein